MRNQLLRDADWASMAHSLEVRVPLVDAVLLEKLANTGLGLGQRNIKSLLAEAPSRPVPHDTIQPSKTGFGVPIAKWIDRQQQSIIAEWKRVPLLRSLVAYFECANCGSRPQFIYTIEERFRWQEGCG
jgi:asparagine synthase (glutamine-hydrolysing)